MQAISAHQVFDGEKMLDQRVVLVEDGRIIDVIQGDPPPSAELVDLGGATLMPGLIDAHVHLIFDGSTDPVGHLNNASDAELLDRMRLAARQTLAAGVTTVRDLGDRDFLALRLRRELAVDEGPEILAAGPPITSSRGHCWFLGGEAAGEPAIRQAVRERARQGAHVVKMMVTGGEMTPGTHSHLRQYGMRELLAAVDEAHRHGLPIAAHAHAKEGIADALAAGFDTIEHCSFMTADDAVVDLDLVRRLADSEVIVSLTAGIAPGGAPPPAIARRIPALMKVLTCIREAGVRVVCGTDAGIGPPKPHGVLPFAGVMLIDLGFDPVETLRSMTSTAAQACRVAGRKGRIAPGLDADLLAVHGDPLTDISALQKPAAVFRMGRRVVG